jgi:hypothetical protein
MDMNTRCFSPSAGNYAYYGGKGVSVCDEWRHDFSAFLTDMGECPEGLTLGRIDHFGNYQKGNCLWETWEQQGKSRRSNQQANHNTDSAAMPMAA